jgi:hypothetical protein
LGLVFDGFEITFYIVICNNKRSKLITDMIGHFFSKYDPSQNGKTKFEQLLDLFTQLLTYTNGDAAEALDWLNQLDQKYKLTDND